MAGGAPPSAGASSASSSGLPPPPPPPKILLAKPPGAAAAPRLGRDDDLSSSSSSAAAHRSRNVPQPGSLSLLSSATWELHTERILPFLTENNDFIVIGIIGPPGVGKSTIMNELYGFDASSPGMLPPFAVQSNDCRSMAKHCTTGIELRVSSERLILLDVQPIFSPSLLVDMMRPDGSSAIPVLNGDPLSADLAHELMAIQLGIFLSSVCNILLVVSEGTRDFSLWQLMLTVDLLKHGIPDPSLLVSAHQGSVSEKETKTNDQSISEEFSAALVFVHSKLRNQDIVPSKIVLLKKALGQFFSSSSFKVDGTGMKQHNDSSSSLDAKNAQDLFLLPIKVADSLQRSQVESFSSMLGTLRDQILSMNGRPFAKNISERDWLRNSAKIWELVKKSPVISDYCRTLQCAGLFRK